mgnify:CR=1 FL=1
MGDMIKVLFYIRKSKTNSDGLAPVYLRVTVNGQRFERRNTQFCRIEGVTNSLSGVLFSSSVRNEK